MNTAIELDKALEVFKTIVSVGRQNFDPHDLSEAQILKPIVAPLRAGSTVPDEDKELLANALYLNAVLDQGRDPLGVKMLLIEVIDQMYQENIRFLHEPEAFFANASRFTEILDEKHEAIKRKRSEIVGIKSYSLLGTRINPYTMHRWGTVMLCLKKLRESGQTLLSFCQSAGRADNISVLIRDDRQYGLGNAIGFKATRLFIKWIMHTYPLLQGTGMRWGSNSYEIPLDSNVGGVFMRSGLLFLFATEEDLWTKKCWVDQGGGRVNLSANKLNDLRLAEGHALVPRQHWNCGFNSCHSERSEAE